MNIELAITEFRKAFFDDPTGCERVSGRITTWKSAYLPYYRRLQKTANGASLSAAALTAALKSYKPASRSKQLAANAFARLAKSANIQLPDEWALAGEGYKASLSTNNKLPHDEIVIDSCLKKIPNQQWRNVFALIAVYGLKNYEPFFLDLEYLQRSQSFAIKVQSIGPDECRIVLPASAAWAKKLGIDLISKPEHLPPISTDLSVTTLQQIGRRSAEQFRRYGFSFSPSHLRYSWGQRAIAHGVPDTLAAKMLGVNMITYVRTYKSEIEKRDALMFDSLLGLTDAPF